MIKLATALIFALALSPHASEGSECLKQVVVEMRADLKPCKDLKGEAKDACRSKASEKAKGARAACPIEQTSSESTRAAAAVKKTEKAAAKADSVAKAVPANPVTEEKVGN